MSLQSPTSALELINYVKAKLGINVVNVEITEDQYLIIIEDALRKFYDYVYDGYEETYISIVMPLAGSIVLDDSVLSVTDVLGALDYNQVNLAHMTESLDYMTGNKRYLFEFSRINHILKITNYLNIDTKMAVRAYKKFDADVYTDIYNHVWLKKYSVALARLQWADNISKYGNVILPGGMILNSSEMMARAQKEIEDCDTLLTESYTYIPLPQMH